MRTALDSLLHAQRVTEKNLRTYRAMREKNSDDKPALGRVKKHLTERRIERRNQRIPEQATYKSLGQFLFDVRGIATGQSKSHERMQTYIKEIEGKAFPSGLNETVLADGGALVPPQWAHELLMRVYDNDLLARVRMFQQLSSNILRIPAINEVSRVDGSRFGGINSFWRQEATSVTATKPSFKTVDLKVESLFVYARATNELLEDMPALETYLGEVVAEEFKFKIGDAIVNGDGVGKPQGLMKSGSALQIAKDGGQAANTISVNNLLNMWAQLWIGCKKNAVWLVHNTTWPQLMQLVVGQFPIFLPANSIAGIPFPTILGRPVIETEFNQQLSTAGDVILCDLGSYLMANKGDMRTFTSMHIYFDTGEQAFRFEMRLDGRSWWQTTLTPKYGNKNLSNILYIQSR
jgi:HK97 family phage major capsid protein